MRILELKRRYFEDYCSDNQYARRPIRRIEDIEGEYSGRYQTWSLLQETPIRQEKKCWDLKDFKDSYYCSVCAAAGYKDTTAAELQLLEDLLLSRG
ncbi:hypothetical protein Tco_1211994 [Tanacetum coccineum]